MKRVILYARVSTSHHDQNQKVQLHEVRRYCEARDWRVYKEIIDHGIVAAPTSAHRQMIPMENVSNPSGLRHNDGFSPMLNGKPIFKYDNTFSVRIIVFMWNSNEMVPMNVGV